MTSNPSCDDIRELAPELALGIASGEERARALEHIAGCPACRSFVNDLSTIADDILLLAPEREPDAGFETRVLDRVHERRTRRRRIVALMAAAAALAAAVAVAGTLVATRADRELAGNVRAALAEANGKYFAVAPLNDAGGRKVGNLFGYEGHPSWVYAALTEPAPKGTYRVEFRLASGSTRVVDTVSWSGTEKGWGRALDGTLHDVAELRFVAPDGDVLLSGAFERPR